MRTLTTSEARKDFSNVIRRVRQGDRVLLSRHDKPCAAIISIADLRLLRQIEAREDVAALRQALAEEEFTSFDDFRAELGL